MSTDPLSQLYKGKCHGQVRLNKRMIKLYGKNMVCQYLKLGIKLGIKYKIYKNAVLCMMIELDRGCAQLIFPYGVCMGTLRFFTSMLIGRLVV
jgi:hypothetical protein